MKLLKPIVLGIFAVAALSLNAQEDHKPHKDGAERHATGMTENLGLNADQAAKIEVSRRNLVNTVRKINSDNTTSQEVKNSQVKAEKARYTAEVKAILTDAQFEKFENKSTEALMTRQDKLDANNTPEASAKEKADNLAAKLTNVTSEQRNNMESLFLKVAQKIEAVKGNANLTADQKKEFIAGNKNDEQNALKMILTDDQNTELAALRANHGALRNDTKN